MSLHLREKKCLNGGCGVPDDEEGGERDEADSGRFSEGETEEERRRRGRRRRVEGEGKRRVRRRA